MKTQFKLKTFTTPLVMLSLVAGSTLAANPSYAGEIYKKDKWGNQVQIYQNNRGVKTKRHHKNYSNKNSRRKDHTGDYLAAGIIGLAFGAILANSAYQNNWTRQYNDPTTTFTYDNLRRSYNPNANAFILPNVGNIYQNDDVITYNESASLEPWSPGWREYCAQRYRSFNPRSGTYKGYDGMHHFCVAK